MVISNAE